MNTVTQHDTEELIDSTAAERFSKLTRGNQMEAEIRYVELYLCNEQAAWPSEVKKLQDEWQRLASDLVSNSISYEPDRRLAESKIKPILTTMVEKLAEYNLIYAKCLNHAIRYGFKYENSRIAIYRSINFLKTVEIILRRSLKDGTFMDNI